MALWLPLGLRLPIVLWLPLVHLLKRGQRRSMLSGLNPDVPLLHLLLFQDYLHNVLLLNLLLCQLLCQLLLFMLL